MTLIQYTILAVVLFVVVAIAWKIKTKLDKNLTDAIDAQIKEDQNTSSQAKVIVTPEEKKEPNGDYVPKSEKTMIEDAEVVQDRLFGNSGNNGSLKNKKRQYTKKTTKVENLAEENTKPKKKPGRKPKKKE